LHSNFRNITSLIFVLVLGFSTRQWAILLTALIHSIFIIWFAYVRIDFEPDDKWKKIKMSFADQEKPEEIEKKEDWVPEGYQEHGLDQKKASVAQTNQAVNEATDQLSKGEREQLEREIDAQVSEMAKNASTTGFMEGGNNGGMSGNLGAPKTASKTKDEKSGSEKGKGDLGNIHDKATNISYFLKDRTLGVLGLKNPLYLCEEGGVVVVNITVNSFGDVVSASVNDKKSNTKNTCLREEAKQAALKSTFNETKISSSKQRGLITYVFSWQ